MRAGTENYCTLYNRIIIQSPWYITDAMGIWIIIIAKIKIWEIYKGMNTRKYGKKIGNIVIGYLKIRKSVDDFIG